MKEYRQNPEDWREHQRRSRVVPPRKNRLQRKQWFGLYGACCLVILFLTLYAWPWLFAHFEKGMEPPSQAATPPPLRVDKRVMPTLLKDVDLKGLSPSGAFAIQVDGRKVHVETSFDMALQSFVEDLVERSQTYRAAAIVLRPDNGQVLAMANHSNGEAGKGNLCLRAEYPAASLFKIVSAAAAMESRGFTPERLLTYRGGKYTLYRGQLTQDRGRSGKKTTLKEAFSESNNPVFGKIGIYHLGRRLMSDYAERFLFNRPIPFDLSVEKSSIELPEDDYGLAEIASGFNKTTTISPLHAALVTASVANGGKVMEPWLVKTVKAESGDLLYQVAPSSIAEPIRKDTAGKMRALMQGTVVSGTGKKAFRSLRHKREFKEVELGAKTGTINDAQGEHRVDWLTAYALPEGGSEGICITILALHGERLGLRAKDMVRRIIDYYYTS